MGPGSLRPGKSCEFSSSGKSRVLKCPQNSAICDKGWAEIHGSNVGRVWSNPQILSGYPQSITLNSQCWILNPHLSILLPQISFIQPQFSIFKSSFSILSKKKIFGSKSPQNSVISDKMSASAACSFFQVWRAHWCMDPHEIWNFTRY